MGTSPQSRTFAPARNGLKFLFTSLVSYQKEKRSCGKASAPRNRVSPVRRMPARPLPDRVRPKARAWSVRDARVEGHAEDGNVEGLLGFVEASRVGEVCEGDDAGEGEVARVGVLAHCALDALMG